MGKSSSNQMISHVQNRALVRAIGQGKIYHMLCMCKIPLLARPFDLKARPSTRATLGYFIWRVLYHHTKHISQIARIAVTSFNLYESRSNNLQCIYNILSDFIIVNATK